MKFSRRVLPVAAAALLLAGCDLLDLAAGEEEGPTPEATAAPQEAPAEEEAGDLEGPSASAPAGSDEGETAPDAESALESGGGTDLSPSGFAIPEDVTLDLAQRHPGGTVLMVSGMRFEGNTILVSGEFINGATRDVRLSLSGGARLRLLDDRGNTYNFVVPEDLGNRLELPQGESIGGDFAFLGPIDRQATTLTLVTNVYDPVELPLDPDDLFDGTGTPEFALEGLALEW